MVYGYIAELKDVDSSAVKAQVEAGITQKNMKVKSFILDEQSNRIDWKIRELGNLVKKIKKGETLATYEALSIARSTTQFLEIVEALAEKGASLLLVKYNRLFLPDDIIDTKVFLDLLNHAEADYDRRRNAEPFEKRTLKGVPLGRPKGRKNKSRKLDKHLPEIKKYLALKISKASIAKLIGCHAQTLYNYLDDKDLYADE
jgi:DNA invertase Pin-like site-specific DNA recombinase